MANSFDQIKQRDFSAGYKPGDDFNNGSPNGLLRMDNVWLDETGALTLTRAPIKVNSVALASGIYKLYGAILNQVRTRFAQLQDNSVVYGTGPDNFPNPFLGAFSPSITIPAALGQGFGRVFGMNHKFDETGASPTPKETDGTTTSSWGLVPQQIVSISGMVQAVCFPFYGTSGTNFTSFVVAGTGVSTSSADGIVSLNYTTGTATVTYTPGAALNLSVATNSGDAMAATDVFYLAVYSPSVQASGNIITVTAQTSVGNTFQHSWGYAQYQQKYSFAPGWFVLSSPRGTFSSTGTPNWNSITKVTITLTAVGSGKIAFSQPFEFYNANNSGATLNAGITLDQTNYGVQLTDPYTYASQSQWSNAQYTGLSGLAPYPDNGLFNDRPIWGKWASLVVTVNLAGIDSRINQINVFKNGGTLGGDYVLVGSILSPFTPATVIDNHPDTYYLSQVGNNVVGNSFLVTPNVAVVNPPITIVGPINGRMVICDTEQVYFTDYLNPEAVDVRLTVKLSGQNNEIILSAVTTSQNVIMVLTTLDMYQISGSMQFQADGTFDIFVQSMGIKQPPISQGVALVDNSAMWIGKDGLRSSFISLVNQLSPDLNLLFRGQTCFGVSGFKIQPYLSISTFNEYFQIAICKQKIYMIASHLDGSRSMFVHDLQHKTWYRRVDSIAPICLFAEQDDTLLCGYPDGFVRTYDQAAQFDNTTSQNIDILTTLQDAGEPNTRKDLFTLKLLFTSAQPINATLICETGQSVNLGAISGNTNTIPYMVPVTVNGIVIDRSRRYALQLIGQTVSFKMIGWFLDVYSHPEPQLFYRQPPSNFGFNGMKRIRTLPIVLDCLGNTVTYQAIVDGANVGPTTTFTGNVKKTYYFMFDSDVMGVDYSYTLSAGGNLFEPYGPMEPVDVEKFPPPKLTDQLGPMVLDKRGKLYGFRVRMMTTGTFVQYIVYMDDVQVYAGAIATVPNVDTTYEVLRMPKSLIGNILRIVIYTPSDSLPFYRWNGQVRVTMSGMKSNQQWLPNDAKL